MPPLSKRKRAATDDNDAAADPPSSLLPPSEATPPQPPTKRRRHRLGPDLLSPLSDELLVRVLTFLALPDVLSVAAVSRRFYALAGDSQVWKHLYYARFVLPRALRIPGFRDGSSRAGKLHYSARQAVWADGRRGGWVDMRSSSSSSKNDDNGDGGGGGDVGDGQQRKPRHQNQSRTWKRQYKLRHNWSKGKCAVEELQVSHDSLDTTAAEGDEQGRPMPDNNSNKMLVKITEGIAVTADVSNGLRAWDLKTKALLAQIDLQESGSTASAPSSLAIDDQHSEARTFDVAIGFADGSFGVWRLDIPAQRIARRYRHEKSSNGELVGVALSHPYLLTATKSVLVSLYTFDGPPKLGLGTTNAGLEDASTESPADETERERPDDCPLQSPYLLTSLKSHTSRAPLALSIRKAGPGHTIASIAYTFSTLQGWSLGIQDLHLQVPSPSLSKSSVDITTRLAYTMPVRTAPFYTSPPTSSPPPPSAATTATTAGDGPTSLCYTHPYLLATLPDNTLLLYLCTSTASALSISPGIRLWGHTSGISDAEITARGKAVSVSCRGEEIRVWELEGRTTGRSVEVKPTTTTAAKTAGVDEDDAAVTTAIGDQQAPVQWDERRNWVGFDDEMVIVLKEAKGGRESLMVYDFT